MAKTDEDFLAGAASCQADPPLGLPISGVVRREGPAMARLAPMEVTAAAFASGTTRVILCGVDTLAIQAPEVDELRGRIAARTGADPAGILLNWNHTHHAPPASRSMFGLQGDRNPEPTREILAYMDYLQGRIVEACQLACERLEPAGVRWGLGRVDEVINRRQRDPDGNVTKIGWNPEGVVDPSVPVLQALRENGSAIATVVSYACHTVTTGVDYLGYSPDYPGPLRDFVRRSTGGECVFLQGAGGNIMPRIAFEGTGEAMRHLGTRLGIEALHAVADRRARPAHLTEIAFGSGTGMALFRWEPSAAPAPKLAAVEKVVEFPLLPLPTLADLAALIQKTERAVEEATKRGASEGELRVLRYHGLNWARRAEKEIKGGSPRTSVKGSINAVRIGDGVIATGPGEVFAEIGLAVKERSPADVTLYAGFTNGAVSYLPTAAEFPLGGYEPAYGNKPYGLPSQVTPECERILTETAVSLIRSLFPERAAPEFAGWLSTGRLPEPPAQAKIERPRLDAGLPKKAPAKPGQ